MGLGLPVFGIPHLAVGVDVASGGLGVEIPIIAAEGFEEGEPLGNAGVVQKVIEGLFNQTGIPTTVAENFPDGGSVGLDRLLVERLERSEDRRDIIEQVPVSVRVGRGGRGKSL
jgi:hypothetical protein